MRTFSIAQCFCLAFGVQGILICMEMPRQIITRIRSTRRKDGSILTRMHLRRMINRFGTFEMLSVRLWRGVFSCTLCRGERKSEPPPYMRGNAGSGKGKAFILIIIAQNLKNFQLWTNFYDIMVYEKKKPAVRQTQRGEA